MPNIADILGLNSAQPGPTNANANAAAVVNGPPPELQPKPPASQEELAMRVNGWQAFQQKLSDPNVARALMFFGAAMGVPMGPNESVAGRFAQSGAVGLGAYELGNLANEEQAKRQAELERIQATTGLEKARTTQVQGQEQRAAELHPAALQRAAAEIVHLEAQTEQARKAGMSSEATARLNNARARIEEDWGPKQAQAAIDQARAAAASSNAAAGASNELRLTRRMEREALGSLPTADDLLVNPDSTTPYQQYLTGTGRFEQTRRSGATSAQVQAAQEYKAEWQKANPRGAAESKEQYDQRASKALTQFMTEAKRKNDRTELIDFMSRTGITDPAEALRKWNELNMLLEGKTPPPEENPKGKQPKNVQWQNVPGGNLRHD